ncbi:MAG: hypothetical protein IJG68_01145 [Bacilli bacterium]|nr:hypothetical protein [Bacilli bacterium]
MDSFNLVKKPKKDENDFDDEETEDIQLEDDLDDSSDSYVSKYENKRKLIRLAGLLIGFILFLFLILWLASIFGGKKAYTYEDVESIMKDASVRYFASHPEYLPKTENEIVELNVINLVNEGYMKDLSEYIKTDTCSGTIQVEKFGNDYLHTPYLNCGDSYTSVELYHKVVEDNPITTGGDGLYSFDNNYVFRGENVNNYVQLDNSLWRIVKINNDGNIVLISENGTIYSKPWDDRFNEEKNYEAGVNNYSVSRIKDYLQQVYTGNVEFDDEKILSDKDRSKIVSHDVCVGKRTVDGSSKNNAEECKQKVQGQKLGLLTLSDYLSASLDPNCKSASTKSCTNYNYLVTGTEWWLATANIANDSEVFKVDQWGIVTVDNAATYATVRPVIYLNTNTRFKEGKGTKTEPYTVR